MIAAAVTYKLSALEHQGRYAERERVSKVVCGTTEELVELSRYAADSNSQL
jgi:hypothetical protein